jgi:hypothetical protein
VIAATSRDRVQYGAVVRGRLPGTLKRIIFVGFKPRAGSYNAMRLLSIMRRLCTCSLVRPRGSSAIW